MVLTIGLLSLIVCIGLVLSGLPKMAKDQVGNKAIEWGVFGLPFGFIVTVIGMAVGK